MFSSFSGHTDKETGRRMLKRSLHRRTVYHKMGIELLVAYSITTELLMSGRLFTDLVFVVSL
jgi:hypothetical protein